MSDPQLRKNGRATTENPGGGGRPPRGELARQLLLLVGLQLFAAALFTAHHVEHRSLYWDNLRSFSLFRDPLHALNYFGEIPWWNPVAGDGAPLYYHLLLGTNSTTPLFVGLAVVAWGLGRLGVGIASYHVLYVVYFGFLVPFLYGLGLLLLARQMFPRRAVVYFVVALGVFSPAAVFNLSDTGIEQSAYSLLFAAAVLRFLKRPHALEFFALATATLALAVSVNHLFLYWNVLFVPLFLATLWLGTDPARFTPGAAARAVPVVAWIALVAASIVCMLPALLAFAQGGDIVRTSSGTRLYSYGFLRAGNPLEVLAAATPGIGFEWSNGFRAVAPGASPTGHLSYGYLGALVLALAFCGLVRSRSVWRPRLFGLIALTSAVILLSAWSPLFALVLAWPTPLRAVNHYSDAVFRVGIAGLVILAAGLGFDAVVRGVADSRRLACRALLVILAWTIALHAAVAREATMSSSILGFALIVAVLALIVVLHLGTGSRQKARRHAKVLLVALVLIDTSTVAYWHVRHVIVAQATRGLAEPSPTAVGMPDDVRSHYASGLLELRQVRVFRNLALDAANLPPVALFGTARRADDAVARDLLRGPRPFDTLILAPSGAPAAEAPPVRSPGDASTVSVMRRTYTSLELRARNAAEAYLFLRIPFTPYWSAAVDGVRRPVERAFLAFVAVGLPAGEHTVVLRFAPPGIALGLGAAYALLVAAAITWIVLARRHIGAPDVQSTRA